MKKLIIFSLFVTGTVTGIHCQELANDEDAIIEIINCETEAYLQHDFEMWSSYWLKSPYTHHNYTTSSYHQGLQGWNALEKAFSEEFQALPDPNYQIEKNNFKVQILGNTAIASFNETYKNLTQNEKDVWKAENNAIFEKKDGNWFIVGYNIVNKTTFKATEYDVLANLNLAGNMLMDMQKPEEAIKVFDLCMEIQPEDCSKYNRLGEVFLNMGKVDLARRYFNKCLIIEPKNSAALTRIDELSVRK